MKKKKNFFICFAIQEQAGLFWIYPYSSGDIRSVFRECRKECIFNNLQQDW